MNAIARQAASELQTLLNEKFPKARVVPGDARHSRGAGIPLEIRGISRAEIPSYQDFLGSCLKQQRLKGPAILAVLNEQGGVMNLGVVD